ncbi:tetratricopeptide repeat protein [Arthrobacter sp.]|uniref:tetratricopeptide repeat protein n=1 Tax=Arthrobacter sp. TaxID=1667 RepID=UPI003A941000
MNGSTRSGRRRTKPTPDASVGSAREAFLALALHDAGRSTEAVQVALLALQDTLPLYGKVVGWYARDLGTAPHAQ